MRSSGSTLVSSRAGIFEFGLISTKPLPNWSPTLILIVSCFALGETSAALRALHMGLVNLWLIYFPFSRLMHAFTFALSRGYTGATYGRRGITP